MDCMKSLLWIDEFSGETMMNDQDRRQCPDGMLIAENISRVWRQKSFQRVSQTICQATSSLPSTEYLSHGQFVSAARTCHSDTGWCDPLQNAKSPGTVPCNNGSDNDLSHDDSLEDADVEYCRHECRKSTGSSIANSFGAEFQTDNEFEISLNQGNAAHKTHFYDERLMSDSLPSPTTDWDTIDSVLTTESGIHSPDRDSDFEEPNDLSSRLSASLNLQMTFVDDMESDIESAPDVEVYEVYDDNLDYLNRKPESTGSLAVVDCDRNLDSRDSGYVPGDLVGFNIERVTDFNKKRDADSLEPAEESRRLLTSLKIHECHERKRREREMKKMNEDARSLIHLKNVEELRVMKEELARKIAEINCHLVCELMQRDDLHAKHESLLMDADDLTKLAQEQQNAGKEMSPVHARRPGKVKR